MILTLHGTGGGLPMGDRMASALTARFADGSLALFDAGEGCSRSMLRDGIDLNRITTVAISHLHPDHWCGLPNLSVAWLASRRSDAVQVRVPGGMEAFIERAMTGSYLFPEQFSAWPVIQPLAPFDLPDGWRVDLFTTTHLDAVRALSGRYGNAPAAFGYMLRNGDRKVVLSQDLGSERDVAPVIDGAELLVIECAHIDIAATLTMARTAGVKRLIFTHLPPEMPAFPEHFDGIDWCVAFDGMQVDLTR